MQDVYEAKGEDADHVNCQWQQKQKEVAVVSPPDAVVHPGTVVVKVLRGECGKRKTYIKKSILNDFDFHGKLVEYTLCFLNTLCVIQATWTLFSKLHFYWDGEKRRLTWLMRSLSPSITLCPSLTLLLKSPLLTFLTHIAHSLTHKHNSPPSWSVHARLLCFYTYRSNSPTHLFSPSPVWGFFSHQNWHAS